MFCRHMIQFHKHDSHFVINCGFQSCSFVTKSWSCFKMHVKRKHKVREEMPVDELMDTAGDVDEYLPPTHQPPTTSLGSHIAPPHVLLSAGYLLSLKADHKLAQKAVDDVVSTTSDLLRSQMLCVKHDILQKLAESGCELGHTHDILDKAVPDNYFDGLETCDSRRKFYRQKLNLVEPQEVYLGTTLVKHRGKIISQRKFGVIVPFERNLKALLAMPEVWHYVQHVHTSNDSVMRDMCDGYVWSANELFSRNPSAPQIF